MTRRSRQLPALAFLAVLLAACDQPSPVSPLDAATARVGAWMNPGPPDHGLAGGLTGLAGLLQVQDGRLLAVADGFVPPPDPDRQIALSLGAIRAAATSLAERAAELERLSGGGFPPGPVQPPDPRRPPNPCYAPGRGFPPDPCRVGILGSIGNALEGADARLADIQAGFLPPPDPDKPAILAALAAIKAAAMSLAQTADALLSSMGG